MSSTEDRMAGQVKDAFTAAAGTIADETIPAFVPPRARRIRLGSPRARGVLVPLAAAAAVAAVAVAAVTVPQALTSRSTPRTGRTSATGLPGGTPPYYLDLVQFVPGPITVHATATGQQTASIKAPHGGAFEAVALTSDPRTFIVAETPANPTQSQNARFYRLRLTGRGRLAQLSMLPGISAPSSEVFALAVSRDGRQFAYASGYNVVLASLTGHQLRRWTLSNPSMVTALSFDRTGRRLAFDATSDAPARSRVGLISTGAPSGPLWTHAKVEADGQPYPVGAVVNADNSSLTFGTETYWEGSREGPLTLQTSAVNGGVSRAFKITPKGRALLVSADATGEYFLVEYFTGGSVPHSVPSRMRLELVVITDTRSYTRNLPATGLSLSSQVLW